MRADGRGRVAAFEILVATPAIRNLIREGKSYQIPTQLQTGGRFGMKTMQGSLRELAQAGVISEEEYRNRLAHLASTGAYVPQSGLGGAAGAAGATAGGGGPGGERGRRSS